MNLAQNMMQKKERKIYEKKLDDEIKEVKNKNLSDIEKDIFVNNLEIMKEYRIQRAINKIYYMTIFTRQQLL